MNREIQSLVGLKSTKKRMSQHRKLSESLSNSLLMEEAIINSEVESYNIERAENISNARTLKEKNKPKQRLNKKLSESIKLSILSESFANLVYSSLILDEDYKEENYERLITNFSETFKGLVEKGLIKTEGISPLYEAYITPAVNIFPSVDSNIEEPEKIISYVKSIETEMDKNEEKEDIVSAVKEKVVDVIKEEKVFASKRAFLMETYRKRYDGTSLFNALNLYNFKEAKQSLLESNEKLTTEEFSKNEKLLEEVNNIALAETICDYTLLECLNTCNLLVDKNGMIAENIKKIVSHLYKL